MLEKKLDKEINGIVIEKWQDQIIIFVLFMLYILLYYNIFSFVCECALLFYLINTDQQWTFSFTLKIFSVHA